MLQLVSKIHIALINWKELFRERRGLLFGIIGNKISFFKTMYETETELIFDYESIIDCITNEKKPPCSPLIIRDLCNRAKSLFLADPSLIHLSSSRPVIISGSTFLFFTYNRLFLRIA